MNKELRTNTKELLDDGVKELIIREGSAAKIHEPVPVRISGVLKALVQFLSSSKISLYDPQKSNIQYDLDDNTIILTLYETDVFQHSVKGTLEVFEDFKTFGINSGKRYTHRDLIQLLKKNKFYFADADEHMTFLKNMENFHAKVTKDIKDARENNGNRASGVSIVVENAMKETPKFKLLMPMFKGYPKTTFEVEVCIDATDSNVNFYFESQEVFQLEKELAEKYILEELTKLWEIFPCSQVQIG